MKRILLLDLNNILFSCQPYHIHEDLKSGGWQIIDQFLVILNSYLNYHKPNIVFCLGDGKPKWRYDLFKEYKANRKHLEPDPLREAFKRNRLKLNDILNLIPVYFIRHLNLEADDLSYIVTNYLNEQDDYEIIAITTDKDWIQLYNYFDNIKIFNQFKKKVVEKFDVNITNFKCLAGDSGDGIIGFKGIGSVTARKILMNKDTFYEWYNNLKEEEKEYFKTLRKIISFKHIPEQYQYEVYEMIDDYDFKDEVEDDFYKLMKKLKINRNFDKIVENLNKLEKL